MVKYIYLQNEPGEPLTRLTVEEYQEKDERRGEGRGQERRMRRLLAGITGQEPQPRAVGLGDREGWRNEGKWEEKRGGRKGERG